jgi:hypothetical protein
MKIVGFVALVALALPITLPASTADGFVNEN